MSSPQIFSALSRCPWKCCSSSKDTAAGRKIPRLSTARADSRPAIEDVMMIELVNEGRIMNLDQLVITMVVCNRYEQVKGMSGREK